MHIIGFRQLNFELLSYSSQHRTILPGHSNSPWYRPWVVSVVHDPVNYSTETIFDTG